jgi:hypothetical protein
MKVMTQAEQIAHIYSQLPTVAQQEVLDFMLFLQQRYGDTTRSQEKDEAGKKFRHSIRDNPAFGMWADLQGDSRELLKQIRQTQWTRS